MKIKKKTFKSFKDKYQHYIKSIKMNIELTQKHISDYSPEYGAKEDLHRDMFRFIGELNLLLELMTDIEMLEGKR